MSRSIRDQARLNQARSNQALRDDGLCRYGHASRGMHGFSLIELMISMVLGLIVLASATAIFVSNRQTYRATEALGRLQETSRLSFELMARDIRQAAGNPCAKDLRVANVLLGSSGLWWANFGNGIQGYDGADATSGLAFGTGAGNRIAGTEAIELKSADNGSGVTVVSHTPGTFKFVLNTATPGLSTSDIVMVCDYQQASIFQITSVSGSSIFHASGTGTPSNCSIGLGVPTVCNNPGTVYTYGPGSMIVKLQSVRWYIGRNPTNTGNSLYRSVLINNQPAVQEIVPDVNSMNVDYLVRNAAGYVGVGSVAAGQWPDVVAVRVRLNMASSDLAGVNNSSIQRTIEHTITLRNRM